MTNQLPEKFLEKLPTFVPKNKLKHILDSFEKEKQISFRANTIKISSDKLLSELSSLGFEIKKIPWYTDAFVLKNKSKEELMSTTVYKKGLLYIQNLSSMIPPLALNPQPNEVILDMAASPGSKTSQLACLMANGGTIVANDKSQKRIFRLLANVKEQGVSNVKTSVAPGEFLWKKYPEHFDKVLIDAPCTMEGRFVLNEPETYQDWSPRKIKELSNLQKWLLRSAISCTKIGGTIIYSTCAISPEENEEVIDWAIKKHSDAISIEDITIPHLPGEQGLIKYKHKTFSPELSRTLRIYPDEKMEGFYVAKIRKLQSTIVLQ